MHMSRYSFANKGNDRGPSPTRRNPTCHFSEKLRLEQCFPFNYTIHGLKPWCYIQTVKGIQEPQRVVSSVKRKVLTHNGRLTI